jgi:hypothetical protein
MSKKLEFEVELEEDSKEELETAVEEPAPVPVPDAEFVLNPARIELWLHNNAYRSYERFKSVRLDESIENNKHRRLLLNLVSRSVVHGGTIYVHKDAYEEGAFVAVKKEKPVGEHLCFTRE